MALQFIQRLRAGVCVAALITATGASAQQVEEVVVTAQKREERLQEVPISVTALSAAALEKAGASSSRDLQLVTPGLVFTQGSYVARPQIRGVGTRGVGAGDEATVPIYIDGVYQSLQHAGFFEFNNIKRIEVLKGPQGTLFGRNAVGGAINIVTEDPTADPQARVAASYGSFNTRKGDLYLNSGLADGLSANVAVHAAADDGYIHDLVRGGKLASTDTFGARAKLRWAPSEGFETILGGSYIHTLDDTALSSHPIDGITIARNTPGVLIPSGYNASLNVDPFFKLHQETAWLSSRLRLDAFDLNFLVSGQRSEFVSLADSDATAAELGHSKNPLDDRAFSSELRATSNGDGKFRWITGVFLFKDRARYGYANGQFYDNFGATGVATTLQTTSNVSSYAAFAEGTFAFTDRLSLTGGLRYSSETRRFVQLVTSTPAGQPLRQPVANGPPVESKFDKISPRASLQFKVSDRINSYFTYSQGFKSGLFNATTTSLPLTAVQPEVLNAYEVGLKTEPARNLRFNLAAYNWDYTDLQVSVTVAGRGSLLQNAAQARIYGAESELQWAVTEAWYVNAGAAYTHARFTSFPGAAAFRLNANNAGYTSVIVDGAGNALPKAPDYTFNLSSDYMVPTSYGAVTVAGSYYWTSHYFSDNGNSYREPSYANLNAQISWADPKGQFKVTVFGENLTDSRHYLSTQISTLGLTGALAKPRRGGLRLEYAWN